MNSLPHQQASDAPTLPHTPFRFVCYFIAKYRWWYLAMVLLEAAHATCGILVPYTIGQIVKVVTTVEHSKLLDHLEAPLMLFILLSIGEVIFGRAGGTCQIITGPRQRQTVTRALYAYMQHHSHRYFSNNFAGALAFRISETSMGVAQSLWIIIFDFWPIGIVITVSIALLFKAHVLLGGLVAGWAVLFISISYWLATRCQSHSHNAAAARSETTGTMVDSIANITSTKLFSHLRYEKSYLNETLRTELKAVRRANFYSEQVRWFQFISSAGLKIGTLYFALSLWRSNEIGVAEFVMAVSLSLLIISEARNLSRRFLEFFEFIGNIANGVNTIVKSHEIIDVDNVGKSDISKGRIEFRNICFGYSDQEKIFNKLNVTIEPGQKVGLVGFSGSGKSTFVSLILRLYDPQTGEILIDGNNISLMAQDDLHQHISLIPQDPNLFHRTLLENIRYGRLDANMEEVIAACKKAHAHDFIQQMKEQYSSMVGERGIKLSGGQRQRIAIARVILKNAPILILDEATSSLDSVTEKAIQETLDEVMQNKTVIVIAHRLSTIAHLDRIIVFDKGQIIEDGTHAELLRKNGAYKQLWSKQAGGFLPENVSEEKLAGQDNSANISSIKSEDEVAQVTDTNSGPMPL